MIIDLVKKSRSYRGYNAKRTITKEELMELADCARLCPSSVNVQPLKYYLSWEKEEVSRIQALTKWAKALPQMTIPHPGMEPTAYIVICQDTQIAPNLSQFQKDVGITAQTILLAATEKGLGGCMIGNFKPKEIKECLQLPSFLEPQLLVALGEPAERVVLTEIENGESTQYYRDDQDVHYVPKRKLNDVVVTKETIKK